VQVLNVVQEVGVLQHDGNQLAAVAGHDLLAAEKY
jgi:hypothetical protein